MTYERLQAKVRFKKATRKSAPISERLQQNFLKDAVIVSVLWCTYMEYIYKLKCFSRN